MVLYGPPLFPVVLNEFRHVWSLFGAKPQNPIVDNLKHTTQASVSIAEIESTGNLDYYSAGLVVDAPLDDCDAVAAFFSTICTAKIDPS